MEVRLILKYGEFSTGMTPVVVRHRQAFQPEILEYENEIILN